MRRPLWLLLSALLAFLSAPARAERPVVVVFDLENRGAKLPAAVVGTLSDYIATRLAEDGYQIVPRAEMKAALRSQKKASYRACYEESCQIELGRELAAEKTLASQVARVGRTCLVTLKLYDLRKSAAEAAGSARGKCSQDAVLESIDAALTKLSGGPSASAERPAPRPEPAAPSEILVIEFDKAMNAMPGAVRARKELKAERKRLQARLDAKTKALRALEAKAKRATGAKRAELAERLTREGQALTREFTELQTRLTESERRKASRTIAKLSASVQAAAAKRPSNRLVFPARNVLYRAPRLDCTPDLPEGACTGATEVRVAVVDAARLFAAHPAALEAKEDLQREFKDRQRALKRREVAVRQTCKLSAGTKKCERAAAELQRFFAEEDKAMKAAEAEANARLYERFRRDLPAVARRHGAGLILEASQAVFVADALDCTSALLPEKGACTPVPATRVGVARFETLAPNAQDDKARKAAVKRLRAPLAGVAARRDLQLVLHRTAVVYAAPEADITADAEKAIE